MIILFASTIWMMIFSVSQIDKFGSKNQIKILDPKDPVSGRLGFKYELLTPSELSVLSDLIHLFAMINN